MKYDIAKFSTLAFGLSSAMVADSAEEIKKPVIALEELVVIAYKRNDTLLSAPVAVDSLSQERLTRDGSINLTRVEHAVPSLNFGRGGRATRGEIGIRGVSDFTRNIGTDARAVVYLDGVPLGRSSSYDINLVDVKQVNVLRGPQGTAFGENTVAGAINVLTNEPINQYENTLDLRAGNLGATEISLINNTPLSKDLNGRLIVSHSSSDGFIDNITLNRKLQGHTTDSVRTKLKWTPSSTLDVNFSADWLDSTADSTNSVVLADTDSFNGFSSAPDPREVAHDVEEFESRRVFGGSLTINAAVDSQFEIVSITAYRNATMSDLNEED